MGLYIDRSISQFINHTFLCIVVDWETAQEKSNDNAPSTAGVLVQDTQISGSATSDTRCDGNTIRSDNIYSLRPNMEGSKLAFGNYD